MKTVLIAPCGMNCSICMAYLKDKNRCPGCRLFTGNEPVTIAQFKIKNCAILKKGTSKFCFECEEFPCRALKHLDKRYRTKYAMSMIENLENIKKVGLQEFIKNENIRWVYTKCGGNNLCSSGILL